MIRVAICAALIAGPVSAAELYPYADHGDWQVMVMHDDDMYCGAVTFNSYGAMLLIGLHHSGILTVGTVNDDRTLRPQIGDMSVMIDGGSHWVLEDAEFDGGSMVVNLDYADGVEFATDLGAGITAYVGAYDAPIDRHDAYSLRGSRAAMASLYKCHIKIGPRT